jgi:NADP-dependent 3-hydroxy acid dehydrogenase YdfG
VAPGLEGRVAAVTGASSGIGASIARALARDGAAVALAARRRDRLDDVAEEIAAEGGRALAVATDVSVEDEARALIERTNRELGGLDILVNSAGHLRAGPFEHSVAVDWRRMIEVNLLGVLHCTHAALPLMHERGGGDIVNVSSVVSRAPLPDWAVYAATKSAVSTFTEALRPEAMAARVRVTLLEPGFTETEMLEAADVGPIVERLSDERGTGLLRADDVAQAVVYAVSQPRHMAIANLVARPFRRPDGSRG